jgi:hypothetical protein
VGDLLELGSEILEMMSSLLDGCGVAGLLRMGRPYI